MCGELEDKVKNSASETISSGKNGQFGERKQLTYRNILGFQILDAIQEITKLLILQE